MSNETFKATVDEFMAQNKDGSQYKGFSIELPPGDWKDGSTALVTVQIVKEPE